MKKKEIENKTKSVDLLDELSSEIIDFDNKEISEEQIYDNSLQIAGEIHDQANVIKKFKHLPKDIKYGYHDRIDKATFTLRSRAYQTYNYMQKIIFLAHTELLQVTEQRKLLYEVETLEDLKEYFELIGKPDLYFSLLKLEPKDLEHYFKVFKAQLQEIKDIHYIDVMFSEKKNFMTIYDEYSQTHDIDTNIDDFGLLHEMMTISELSKAFRGQERKNMNTTINITRDINEKENVEEDFDAQETGGFGSNFKNKINNLK